MPATPNAKPNLSRLLRDAGAQAREQVRVAIPAVVISFDAAAGTCCAQPLIQEPLADGGHRTDPALADVPVCYPGTARDRVRFPLVKGDQVLLVFQDRAIDGWALGLQLPEATSPKAQTPAERRHHDFTDAVAYPISTCAPANRPIASDRLEVTHGDVTLALTDAGTALIHDGTASQAVALATKADLDALALYVRKQFGAAGTGGVGHTHGGPGGTTVGITAGTAAGADSVPSAAGTSVLRGK